MIFEVAHQAGLIPLVAMLLWGRSLPGPWWLVASAFAVSWVGDSAQELSGGGWAAWYWFLPLQLALAWAAFTESALERVGGLAFFTILGASSAALTAPSLDWMATTVGSLAVLWAASRDESPMRWPVALYFGAGTVAYLLLVTALDSASGVADWMPYWYAYQGARMSAFVAFLALLYRARRST